MNDHTPGPWRLENWSYEDGKRVVPTIQTDKDAIAQMVDLWCMDDRASEAQANARLIAAAPDLLAFAEHVLEAVKRNAADMKPGIAVYLDTLAAAAINKATGN